MGIRQVKKFLDTNEIGSFDEISEIVRESLYKDYLTKRRYLISLDEDFIFGYIAYHQVDFEQQVLYRTSDVLKTLVKDDIKDRDSIIKFINKVVVEESINNFDFFKLDMSDIFLKREEESFCEEFTNTYSLNNKHAQEFIIFLEENNIKHSIQKSFEEYILANDKGIKFPSEIIKDRFVKSGFKEEMIGRLERKLCLHNKTLEEVEYREIEDRSYITVFLNEQEAIRLRRFYYNNLWYLAKDVQDFDHPRLQLIHQYIPCLLKSILKDKSKIYNMKNKIASAFWYDDIEAIVNTFN